ncbi:hypothetical protein DFH06DRAFT_1200405 [Mycena polygramma]|nr:hypothetical protein DFH06DRAFT_1200405 [Mycena polygramma]
MKLIDLGHDILLEICAFVFEDNPRDRPNGSFLYTSMNPDPISFYPGAPAQILLNLAPMHSELATATRPYIWREVFVAIESPDKPATARLERARRPHIAPFVRALFVVFRSPSGTPAIADTLPLFTSLRVVCLYNEISTLVPMTSHLAKGIREHPSIEILCLSHMSRCGDFNPIPTSSLKAWRIGLDYCHKNSVSLLLQPNTITSLRLQCQEAFEETDWPTNIWETLEHLDPGFDNDTYPPRNHRIILSSLQKYVDRGRRPALRSLNLSSVAPGNLAPWLALPSRIQLDMLAYIPSYAGLTIDVVRELLATFYKVKWLEIELLVEQHQEEGDNELRIDRDMLAILSKLPSVERLTLTVELPYYIAITVQNHEAVTILARPLIPILGEGCAKLRSVRLVFKSEWLVRGPAIIKEYNIIRRDQGVDVETVTPRLLDGTVFEFFAV